MPLSEPEFKVLHPDCVEVLRTSESGPGTYLGYINYYVYRRSGVLSVARVRPSSVNVGWLVEEATDLPESERNEIILQATKQRMGLV